MKRSLALIPATLLAAGLLTGCSSDGGGSTEATEPAPNTTVGECAEPGAASEAVALEGGFGEDVTVTSELPVTVTGLEKSTLISSDGDQITDTDEVVTKVQVFNGRDGKLMESTTTVLALNQQFAEWVTQSLNCSSIGDRAVVVVPAIDVFGERLESLGDDGPGTDDSLIIVTDFTWRVLDQAVGTEEKLGSDLPEVKVADSGEPTITIPSGVDAPEKLTIATLVTGEGEPVEAGDTVIVHYRGVIWATGEEFDSSWSRGQSTMFSAATSDEAAALGATQPVIRGFRDALVGQTVGSRVLSIVPAEDGGYGAEALKSQGHKEDAVMVFVLDILAAVPPQG